MKRPVRRTLLATAAALAIPGSALADSTGPIDLLPKDAANSERASRPVDKPVDKPVVSQSLPVAPVKPVSQTPVNAPLPQPTSVAEAFAQEVVQDVPSLTQPWTLSNAQALVLLVKKIGTDGLDPADYDLPTLQAAIAAGPSAALDETASRIFSWVVEDLRDGRTPMDARVQWFVFDPDADRYPTASLMSEALASGDLVGTLARIMPEHPDYLRLKAELAKTPVEQKQRRILIRANMDRWRWLPRDLGSQYLITNVPEFELRLTVNDQIVRTYKTVVGKPGRTATPQLAESVEGVIFNPTWTVPQSIVKGENLGTRVLANPAWAKKAGYKATKGEGGWINVVQQPGPTNSLGLMKLDMPNRHAIFLHDTPSRWLFTKTDRALSHGCIRTERATELAITLAILQGGLTPQEGVDLIKGGEYTRVGFIKPMPVYITYFTMAQNIGGKLATFDDIYDRDAPVIASFAAPRKSNRSRVTNEQVIPIEDDLRT